MIGPTRARCATLTGLLGLLLAAPARADALHDKAAAEALFREGLRLMQAGQLDAACPKLAESERLDPAAGTLLNLAGCYERVGQLASAWVSFDEAIRASQARGRADWESLARRKAADLEPRIPRVRITLPPDPPPRGMAIDRDGSAVQSAEIGTPVPVDPGMHTVTVNAPGRVPWHESFEALDGKTVDVAVPVLALAATVASGEGPPTEIDRPSPARPVDRGRIPRTVGYSMVAFGGASLIFGGVAVAVALHDKAGCTPYPDCASTPGGARANDAAHSWATVATVSFIAGASLAAIGLTVALLSPRRPPLAAQLWRRDVFGGGASTLQLRW
jgi:hypothetical protein